VVDRVEFLGGRGAGGRLAMLRRYARRSGATIGEVRSGCGFRGGVGFR